MTKRIYGHTKAGTPITDEMIEKLSEEAAAGYDVDEIIARSGKRDDPDSARNRRRSNQFGSTPK